MKRLFESYKDYFRLGAAICGIILMNDDEKAKLYENINDWLFFIDSVYEANNMDNLESRVNLLTAHSSKGLEFNTVFIVGLQEGIFPHDKALTKENIEEERRLLYVCLLYTSPSPRDI